MSDEKKQSLFNLFPLALFRDTIEITEKEREVLVNEILSQEKNSKNTIDKGKQPAWTGDTQGYEFLFKNKKFEKLFSLISLSIKKYTSIIGLENDKFDFYYQRSWATISRGHENIGNHRHAQSHVSFAYYLSKNKDDSKITFLDENKHNEIIPSLFDSMSLQKKGLVKKRTILNSPVVIFDTKEDDIVIFPSKTLHATQKGTFNAERISISADICFIAKNSSNLEHLMTPLNKWKLFS